MYKLLRNGQGPIHRKVGQKYRIRYKNFMKWATEPEKGNGHV